MGEGRRAKIPGQALVLEDVPWIDLEVALDRQPAGVYLVRSVLEGVALPTVTVTKR